MGAEGGAGSGSGGGPVGLVVGADHIAAVGQDLAVRLYRRALGRARNQLKEASPQAWIWSAGSLLQRVL